ncbi:GNAT family N-acetyltransferase [Streptomyces anandii]|uniref:GNAT family N-acetyltransferase n=1 Tax=Streptomyces anandii TaxID=285454 RepID=UPI003702972D
MTLESVLAEDLAHIHALLAAARERGLFDTTPSMGRLAAVVGQQGGDATVARVAGRIKGFAAVGAMGLVAPPSTQAALVDIVTDDEGLQAPLADWAITAARRLPSFRSLRTLRGRDVAGPVHFSKVREVWRMDCDLNTSRPVIPCEDVDIVDYGTHTITDDGWVQVINESFAEHWGGYLPWTLERWRERLTTRGTGLELMARRHSEPAGVILGRVSERDDGRSSPAGFIEVVGTLPSHRRRGIAEVLVRSALDRFSQQGLHRALLMVDAGSSTRAAEVYARCGFERGFRYAVWELPLHPAH